MVAQAIIELLLEIQHDEEEERVQKREGFMNFDFEGA